MKLTVFFKFFLLLLGFNAASTSHFLAHNFAKRSPESQKASHPVQLWASSHGQNCVPYIIQTLAGGWWLRSWALVTEPGYTKMAKQKCGNLCAYRDQTRMQKGLFCIPSKKNKVEKVEECKLEAKKYVHGEEQLPQCKWGYDNDDAETVGPEKWKNWWPACKGRSQSPIDVQENVAEPSDFGQFSFEGYDISIHGKMNDNGHSLVFSDDPEHPTRHAFSGGHFPKGVTYKLVQIHWHWGLNNSVGSEHLVNGIRYPMEIHMVHYNEKYPNMSEATKHPDGIAVNAFLYQLSETDNPGMNKMMEFVYEISGMDVDHPITNTNDVQIKDFFPIHNNHKYYFYDGSFTTPPCTQGVSWTLFESTETISARQLDTLRTLKNNEGKPLGNTFRPAQLWNARNIYKNWYNTL